MADIPDEFLEDWREGHFPANRAMDWLSDHPDIREDIDRYMDAGLSLEWGMALEDENVPMPDEWDHVTIHRDSAGDYDVIISAGGDTFTIDAAANDEIAQDSIWGDFWFDVLSEYDIDVERDFEGYSENPS